ncbi:peroxisomal biogenesis protein family-domain-containing protein [Scheffersomyces coipomensis]|uniref:peroxisomal biogenesis protein family-domain-containing protein n=1 Tax=Scheffersomyces coipomensis TaxID=1788519 RepID=UPI00315DC7EF
MSPIKKASKNPQLWITALIATSIVTLSYKLYQSYTSSDTTTTNIEDGEEKVEEGKEKKSFSQSTQTPFQISKAYLNKSIALTLSSSILNSKLPLDDILIKGGENIIFILPPNLSEDDLNYNLKVKTSNNFKLLKCSNINGYVQMLKNLKPDLLLICSDDLGLSYLNLSKDLNNFIKTIVNLDQNSDDVYLKISRLFI